ncbi:MAG: ArsR family transcriptional regulator [Bacillota bacterium]|nr:ArsR family transcriptional regulator [Bacillota bacterium]
MPGDLQKAERIFIDEMDRFFRAYGANETMGRIAGLLIFADRPLSLQEVAAALGVSKAAVSIHIRALERTKFCRRLPPGRDRKDYYVIESDFSETLFASSLQKLEEGRKVAEKALAAFPHSQEVADSEKEKYRLASQRLREYRELLALSQSCFQEVYRRWKLARQEPKEGEDEGR